MIVVPHYYKFFNYYKYVLNIQWFIITILYVINIFLFFYLRVSQQKKNYIKKNCLK